MLFHIESQHFSKITVIKRMLVVVNKIPTFALKTSKRNRESVLIPDYFSQDFFIITKSLITQGREKRKI